MENNSNPVVKTACKKGCKKEKSVLLPIFLGQYSDTEQKP